MSLQNQIEAKLQQELTPRHMEVLNESHRHNVPKGSETHFKVTVASDKFNGLSLVQRHREVYRILAAELSGGVHALALHTYTMAEWEKTAGAPKSPPCAG